MHFSRLACTMMSFVSYFTHLITTSWYATQQVNKSLHNGKKYLIMAILLFKCVHWLAGSMGHRQCSLSYSVESLLHTHVYQQLVFFTWCLCLMACCFWAFVRFLLIRVSCRLGY
ncbi:hypothetical protein NP493_5054g00004 [Ridgeia piscesae]|uniref:Uncharacterized protein n=1 Tax=Ridgeia piscesae TaxID=27915 RepID=A0AAD9MQQ7_RIDPI|nr:hypothetical protein NP493_5054g00004 [Ridgeia piscesae]